MSEHFTPEQLRAYRDTQVREKKFTPGIVVSGHAMNGLGHLLHAHAIKAAIYLSSPETSTVRHSPFPLTSHATNETKHAVAENFRIVCDTVGMSAAKDLPLSLTKDEVRDAFVEFHSLLKPGSERNDYIRMLIESAFKTLELEPVAAMQPTKPSLSEGSRNL